MMSRSSDGRFCNHNEPVKLTDNTLRARWLEGEVLRMKRLGFSYEAIAQQITKVGRGEEAPLTPLPESIRFPPDYTITSMGCHKALRRALKRAPRLDVEELRQIDTERCEDMYLSLSPSIRKGDPQAVRAGVQVLSLKAAINNYKSADAELKVSPGPGWSSLLGKDETVSLLKEAMALLIQHGIQTEEMTRAVGLELPAIEIAATKVDKAD